ncbi:MAG: hypothetical protein LQ337_002707 [Flavoplaca oasis]|nr:MAG: hypothetical protein LQ337_002707 [Flavoplaca oasis]
MQHNHLHSAALLLASIAGVVMSQATTSVNPLNDFIGSVNSAAADLNSAAARETPASSSSSSSTTPTQAAATSASPSAAPSDGGINRTTLIVAIVCAIIGALLIALLVGLCCWCLARRRRRRRLNTAHQPIDEEVKTWRSNEPKQPGRDYSPHRSSHISMEQQPMIPPAAKVPDMQQHPALRNNSNAENPFVPMPPSPRRQAPNSRAGLTDGTVPGEHPYVLPEAQRLDKPRSRSNSRPRNGSNTALPTTNTTSRPSTPFGLSGIGRPYEDTHVHVLQTDHPSNELRQSLQHREPIASPPSEPIHRYDTPPTGSASYNPLAQHPHPSSTAPASNYNTGTSNNVNTNATHSTVSSNSSTEGSTSADDWRYNKASTTFAGVPPWEQRQHRYSNSPSSSARQNDMPAAPPIPWDDREARYQSPSHSPRQSRDWKRGTGGTAPTAPNGSGYVEGARRNSRSPATSINGQPRRLRFSDLTAEDVGNGGVYRHSQGVGEAL